MRPRNVSNKYDVRATTLYQNFRWEIASGFVSLGNRALPEPGPMARCADSLVKSHFMFEICLMATKNQQNPPGRPFEIDL